MKNLLFLIALFFVSAATTSFTKTDMPLKPVSGITIDVEANPDGSITASWEAVYTGEPTHLTISVAWAKKINDKTIWSGVYSWWAYNPSNGPLQLSGTRTVFPPPGSNVTHATVLGIVCDRTGPDWDDYICAETVTVGPIKLNK